MILELFSFAQTLNFEFIWVLINELYHDLVTLVGLFKGSSTAVITNGSL